MLTLKAQPESVHTASLQKNGLQEEDHSSVITASIQAQVAADILPRMGDEDDLPDYEAMRRKQEMEDREQREYYDAVLSELGDERGNLNDLIQVRINGQIKNVWEDAADELGYGSTSALIRIAVAKEISGYYEEDSQQQEVLEGIYEMLDGLQSLERVVQKTNEQIITEDELQEVLEMSMEFVKDGDEDG